MTHPRTPAALRDRQTVDAIADRMFAAVEAGDIETFAASYSDNVTVWHTGDPRVLNKARAVKLIQAFIAATRSRRYEVLRRRLCDGGFVQEHMLHVTAGNGAAYSTRAAMIIDVGADGLITRIDEYFDPADLAPLRDQDGTQP